MQRPGRFLILILLILSVSCLDDADCLNLNNNFIGITFKNMDGSPRQMSFVAITSIGATDTIAANVSGTKFILPLDYTAAGTFYTLSEADTAYTFSLGYNVQTQFISQECGERFVLSNLEIAKHEFDSIRIISKTPGVEKNANNIEFFLD